MNCLFYKIILVNILLCYFIVYLKLQLSDKIKRKINVFKRPCTIDNTDIDRYSIFNGAPGSNPIFSTLFTTS